MYNLVLVLICFQFSGNATPPSSPFDLILFFEFVKYFMIPKSKLSSKIYSEKSHFLSYFCLSFPLLPNVSPTDLSFLCFLLKIWDCVCVCVFPLHLHSKGDTLYTLFCRWYFLFFYQSILCIALHISMYVEIMPHPFHATLCSIVWVFHNLVNRFLVDVYLGCFQ